VITIMCFLASLTAGAVYMMSQSANQWLRDMASEVTVQVEIRGRDKGDVQRLVADVAGFLSRQQGVARVRPLSLADSSQLLEPWLGKTDALSELPVPRLIAVELDRVNPPANFEVLRAALANNFPGVMLDDHRRWQRHLRTVTRSFALGGFAILLLMAAATTAIIVSATKSAMASNRDIVEVLHFVGATDRFIAREFERHFLRLGVRAGVVGAVLAILVFLGIPTMMELLGGGSVPMAELRRLVGFTNLDLWGYLLLGIVVLVIASLCMVTSRIGVFRILNSQH
jgi:cell division transport system permease protein